MAENAKKRGDLRSELGFAPEPPQGKKMSVKQQDLIVRLANTPGFEVPPAAFAIAKNDPDCLSSIEAVAVIKGILKTDTNVPYETPKRFRVYINKYQVEDGVVQKGWFEYPETNDWTRAKEV